MKTSVDVAMVFPYVVISHNGVQHGLSWSHAEQLYLVGKKYISGAEVYDDTGVWTTTAPSEEIAGLQLCRMGLMILLLKNGRKWIEAPYEVMQKILKVVYRKAVELRDDTPLVALKQIEDQAILFVTASPIGITNDLRKIEEALKLTPTGVPPLGIVGVPTVIGGK